jgi:hypothetical protein
MKKIIFSILTLAFVSANAQTTDDIIQNIQKQWVGLQRLMQ